MPKDYVVFTTPHEAQVRLVHDSGRVYVGVEGSADGRPAQLVTIDDDLPEGHGAALDITWPGRAPVTYRGTLWLKRGGPRAELAIDDFTRPFRLELPALAVNGQFFATAHGPHTVIGCSDFLLFQQFAAGQDIAPVVAERRAIGFNDLRIFLGIQGGLGTFDPRPHLDLLPGFCKFIGSSGLRIEFTFGDWKRWCPQLDQQRRLLHDVADQILSSAAWTRIEGMNEGDHLDNMADGIVNEQLDPSILWCLGSRIQDAGTMTPIKSYGTYHPQRTSDWPRKTGHNCMEVAQKHRVPCVSNECKRPDEDGNKASNFFDAAANAALLCAGATFHSQAGKASRLFTDDEQRCAEAWVAGANAVPLAYQQGSYTAGHLSNSPVEYRPGKWSHARVLGNKACLSVPQNSDGWVTRNGWRVVKQTGTVMELER